MPLTGFCYRPLVTRTRRLPVFPSGGAWLSPLRRPRRSAAGDPRSYGLAPDHLAVSRTSGDAALDGASPASTVSPPALPHEGGRPAEPLLTRACAPRRCRPRTRTCDTASDALCRPRKALCRPADMLPRARAGSPAVASTTAASPVQSVFHRLGAPDRLSPRRTPATVLVGIAASSRLPASASPLPRGERPGHPVRSSRSGVWEGRTPPIDFCKQDSLRASTTDRSSTLFEHEEQAPHPRPGLVAGRLRQATSRGRAGQGLARR